jgi:DNA polymerase-3 subunit alpha
MGLFDMGAIESAPKPVSESRGNEVDVDQRTLLDWEKEHLGLFLSDHPLTQVFERYVGLGIVPIREIPEREVGSVIRMVGMVSGVRRITTRNNTQMAIVDFQDVTGNMELVLFAKSVEQWGHLFETDAILDIKAKIEKRNEQIQLLLESATNELREHPAPVPREDVVQLRMPLSDDKWTDNRMMQRIDAMLQEHEGDCVVIVTLVMGQSEVTLKSRSRRVDWTPMLQSDIEDVLGEGSVQFITPREMVTTLLRDR